MQHRPLKGRSEIETDLKVAVSGGRKEKIRRCEKTIDAVGLVPVL